MDDPLGGVCASDPARYLAGEQHRDEKMRRIADGWREICNGCRRCFQVGPQAVGEMDADERAVFARRERFAACRACHVQRMTGVLFAPRVGAAATGEGAG